MAAVGLSGTPREARITHKPGRQVKPRSSNLNPGLICLCGPLKAAGMAFCHNIGSR